MKNRITEHSNKKEKENKKDLNTFFLACELKPNEVLFSVLDPFAYDIRPAFIYGSLGVTSYDPMSYSIIDIDDNAQPLLGYLVTISEPDTQLLLDKLKGCNGPESFNTHEKRQVQAYTDIEKNQVAWIYQLNEEVLEHYESLEQVEFGLTNDDETLLNLLEQIGESL